MKQTKVILIFLFLSSLSFAQKATTFSGYVTDAITGEVLIGANIRSTNQVSITSSNKYGFFSFSTVEKAKIIDVSFVGYKTQKVILNQDRVIEITLEPEDKELAEVKITTSQESTQNRMAGVVSIPVQRLKSVPMVFGETDVLKALALTPGVNVGNEGTSGLLVRGGTPDQNLILLDDAHLYNQSHLFGFASTFNADAIKKIDLYKGAVPARFGGRLSSVVDVTMNDGNDQETKKEFSIGLLSSRFLIEGPIQKNKTSFMLSARSSYLSLFLLPSIIGYNKGSSDSYFNYWLYDVNAKITHRIDSTKRLSFSVFRGHDYFYAWDGGGNERSKFQLDWGNMTSTLKYNQMISKKIFFSSLLAYTRYEYKTGFDNYLLANNNKNLVNAFHVSSSIRDWILKTGFEYFMTNNIQFRAGSETILHQYLPSAIQTTYKINQVFLDKANTPIKANEQAIYAESEIALSRFLKFNIGARNVFFNVQSYNYTSFEPRLSVNLSLPNRFALKASYNQMRQYIHLLSSSTIGLQNDLWVPATQTVKPEFVQQLSVGISKDIPQAKLQISVEAYRKNYNHLIDFKTGTDALTEFDKSWEDKIEKEGIGLSEGIEFFINKTEGRTNGWLSYTYSKNIKKFDNINDGQWFRANYDRRHVVAINLSQYISKKTTFAAVWQYNSGQPATVPVASIRNPEIPYPDLIYKDRNTYQAPDFHRLDISLSFRKISKRQNLKTWTVGIVNVYNRRNPFFLSISKKLISDNTIPSEYKIIGVNSTLSQTSLFPILPYVSYSIKFR